MIIYYVIRQGQKKGARGGGGFETGGALRPISNELLL